MILFPTHQFNISVNNVNKQGSNRENSEKLNLCKTEKMQKKRYKILEFRDFSILALKYCTKIRIFKQNCKLYIHIGSRFARITKINLICGYMLKFSNISGINRKYNSVKLLETLKFH
jgi:hypothetical protein